MYGKPNDGSNGFVLQHQRSGDPASGQPGAEGERGLGATVIGGAGGAFLG